MRRAKKQMEERLARRAVAAEWIEALKSEAPHELAAFDRWLRESKLNVESFLELEALDRQIKALDASDRPDIEGILTQTDVLPLGREFASVTTRPASKVRSFLAAAAGIAVIAFLAGVGYREWHASEAQQPTTATGEQRTIALSDGSLVRMNVETALKIEYGTNRRRIRLLSGEATFKVAHDARRPFIVQTPTATVQALGTEFNVYQRTDTVVSVLEGRVQVKSLPIDSTSDPPSIQRLDAGEEVQIKAGLIRRRAHPDVSKAVAWRRGQAYFDGAPLEVIVEEFNRHDRSTKLRLQGIPPNTYRFGGTFNVEEPESLADILARQSDLIVEKRQGEIVVTERSRE